MVASRLVAGVALAVALTTAPALTQRTWIVDAANGPNTNFTDLPPAFAAASNGDRILIRAGTYDGGTVRKALRIVGEAGVKLGGQATLIVERIPVGATVAISGLVSEAFVGDAFVVRDNPGIVTLHDVSSSGPVGGKAISITNCRYVALSGNLAYVRADGAGLSIASASIQPAAYIADALELTRSTALVTDSTLTGGPSTISGNPFARGPGNGIWAHDNSVVVLAGTVVARGGASLGSNTRPAYGLAARDSELTIDPNATLTGTRAPGLYTLNCQVRIRPVPGVGVNGGAVGGTLQATLSAPPGSPAVLAVSAHASPRTSPLGIAFLDPLGTVILTAGTTGAQGLVAPPIPVPNDPRLRGTALQFQGFAAVPALTWTVPASTILD